MNEPGGVKIDWQTLPHRGTTKEVYRFSSISPVRTQHSHVVREIGREIVAGTYAEGALLPGDVELIERFAVSRTVLREAMKTLAGKGMIKPKARIGTRVQPKSDWNFFDADLLVWHAEAGLEAGFLDFLAEMRMALEPEAAALAAGRRTDEDLKLLDRWVSDMAVAKDINNFVVSDLKFHLAVAAASGNPFMRSLNGLIEVALFASLTISSPVSSPERMVRSVADHRAILAAIANRDPEAASRKMRSVILEGATHARGQIWTPQP